MKNFQQMNALVVNGIVDGETWYHLSVGLLSVIPIESEFAPNETQSLNLC